MTVLFKRLKNNAAGATAIEYGLLAALLVVAVMTAFAAFGNSFKNMSNDTSATITKVVNK